MRKHDFWASDLGQHNQACTATEAGHLFVTIMYLNLERFSSGKKVLSDPSVFLRGPADLYLCEFMWMFQYKHLEACLLMVKLIHNKKPTYLLHVPSYYMYTLKIHQ